MYLDYSKLEFNSDGNPETPVLVLKTMAENTIGIIPGVLNLHLNIKFSEPSEISFDVPSVIDGKPNWIYKRLTGHKIVYTKHYGVYLITNPSTESDGVYDMKHVNGYSIEKGLDSKKFFLEEGTFKFYDQANPNNSDTIMGRILEVARGWKVGYVSSSLAQRYRTFDQYDDYLLDFIYNTVPDKFRGIFVFDPYERTINVYSADDQLDTLPIYLDFDNLLESIDIEEVSDDLVTALRPYGSDDLDIRDVNPIGTNWIYDLSYFISNGDISDTLAKKWDSWQRSILNYQQQYRGLVALRSSTTAQLLSEKVALVDLQGELNTLVSQQSVTIQALAMETTDSGKQTQQSLLDEVNTKISAKKEEISAKEDLIASIEENLDLENPNSYSSQIQTIVNTLSITNYFTDSEYSELSQYLIEKDITENSFVATSVNTTLSGTSYTIANEVFSIQKSLIVQIDLTDKFKKRMYTFSGGTFELSGSHAISGDIIRGTLEENDSGEYVLSLYGGSISSGIATASSGMVTVSGVMSDFSSDIQAVTVDEVVTYQGTKMQFHSQSGSLFLTANISDYQKYSVQMELFDYAVEVLSDLATPTYEFSVDSGNFIFANEFAPFRNRLELGKGVYLNVGDRTVITPYIIEFELDFEDRENLSIVFSNRFKRHDSCNTLKDMIEQSYSAGRNFDASKYIYNQTVNYTSAVSEFMNSTLDAAKNAIIAAGNQSVVIDGAGIHVGGGSNYQLRIVDNMIAMTDDNWAHAKLAIGLFSSEEVGTHFGVNADVIGGKLIVGNNLVIENETDTGVMQFKVDSSGAWLNNSTFILQKDNGGRLILDPNYGIVAGTSQLFYTDGTTVTPGFINNDGDVIFDKDGMPENANFYLDLKDGSAYFRGKVKTSSGSIGGWELSDNELHCGTDSTFVALNSSPTTNSLYAMWAGATKPENAKFWVKRDGTLHATDGEFSGTLSASILSGNLTADEQTGGWLEGCGINVNDGAFYVDQSGNVTMKGSINMSSGSILWGSENSPCLVLYCMKAIDSPNRPYNTYPSIGSTDWHKSINASDLYASYTYDGGITWTSAIKIRGEDGHDGQDGVNGSDATVNERNVFNVLTNGGEKFGIFGSSTNNTLYINANYIRSGKIDADLITLGSSYGGFRCAIGSDGVSTTYGAMMYGSDSNYYFIATNKGVRMQSKLHGLTITDSGLYADEEIVTNSDRRLKQDIEYQLDKYEDFFMLLRPTQYKYTSGTSNRFHIGFIAQDVEQALADSGLTNSDFAGLVISPVEEITNDSIKDFTYRIRYGEFISLNTYMIQRLQRKIENLEAKINSMS